MLKLHDKKKCSVIATKLVNKKTVSRWGILSGKIKIKIIFKLLTL